MPAGLPHGLRAETPAVMLLTLYGRECRPARGRPVTPAQ